MDSLHIIGTACKLMQFLPDSLLLAAEVQLLGFETA
jgi:hypothetical protein